MDQILVIYFQSSFINSNKKLIFFKGIENYLFLRQIRMDDINSNIVECKFPIKLHGSLLFLDKDQYWRI
jgi:hypothetical protein